MHYHIQYIQIIGYKNEMQKLNQLYPEFIMYIRLLFLCSLFASFSTYSQWYETKGQAFIINNGTELARTKAIENALKRALLVGGASVSSVQQVVNGLLTQDEINIRASASINSLEIVDETYTDKFVTVTIRADIFPQEQQCFSADYRKSLLITRSNLLHQEQANIGSIYALDTVLMKKLSYKLNNEGLYLDTRLALKNKTRFSRFNQSLHIQKIKQLAIALADATDTQYILFSEIQDISLDQGVNNSWQFWQEDVFDRHFNLALYIYNGSNGELVFQQDYQNSAPWTFAKRKQVDVNSQTFWHSDYGNIIDQTLNQMITDIDENMMCQLTRGKIVQVNGNKITINLGSRHGVQVGDEFSLLHLNNFTSDSGNTYAGFNVSSFKVKVTDVSLQSAKATTTNNHLLGNIQVNDLAVRY